MAEPDQARLEPQLSFKMSPGIAAVLTDLIELVRQSGHARPSQRTLVQALIHAAPRDGEELEAAVLAPYRRANPDEA